MNKSFPPEAAYLACPDFTVSERMRRRAHAIIPGGAHTYAKGDDQFPELAPGFIARGKGCHVWDVDGNEFIEYGMGTAAVGARPRLCAAWSRPRARECCWACNFTRPAPHGGGVRRGVPRLVAGAEMVKFAKDGSDATSAAVKLARAYTGRDLVAICGDHPFFSDNDWFIGTTPIDGGIPEAVADDRRLQLQRHGQRARLFARHPGQIAVVIMEPARTEEPRDGFLQGLQRLCHARRRGLHARRDDHRLSLAPRRRAGVYGVTPDLSSFGKAMANGFSVSALAGKREFMGLGGLEHTTGSACSCCPPPTARKPSAGRVRRDHADLPRRAGDRAPAIDRASACAPASSDGRARRPERHVQFVGRPCCLLYGTLDAEGRPSQAFRTLFLQEIIRRGVLAPCSWSATRTRRRHRPHDRGGRRRAGGLRRALEDGVEHHLHGRPSKLVYRAYN